MQKNQIKIYRFMGQKVNPLGFRLGVSQKHISHWFVENNNYAQLVVEDQFIRNFFYKNFPGVASINIKRDLNRIVIEIFSSNTRDLLTEGGQSAAKATLLSSEQGRTRRVEEIPSSASEKKSHSGSVQINSVCDQLLKELTIFRNNQSRKKTFKNDRLFKSNDNKTEFSYSSNSKPSHSSSELSQDTELNPEVSERQNLSSSPTFTEFGAQSKSTTNEKPVEVELFVTKVENPNSSAACLAEFIVEQLEKRMPFRRVLKRSIQKAEEGSVGGVKVQISGRLNGAEIARSERIHKGQVPLHTLRAKIEYDSRTAKTIYGLLGVKVWVFNGFADIN